jgi:hypothetical protein
VRQAPGPGGLRLPLADGLVLETDTIIEHLASDAAAAPTARAAGRAVPARANEK